MSNRIDDINFQPQKPIIRSIVWAVFFTFMLFALFSDYQRYFTTDELTSVQPVFDLEFWVNLILEIVVFVTGIVLVISWLRFPFQLHFTEQGIRRRTLLPPKFVSWNAVLAAKMSRYKGNLWLDLQISAKRWVVVPLLEYGKSEDLVTAIKERLPVDLYISPQDMERLRSNDRMSR
jgi:hypothetical protein